jgi:hypothetical protein
VTRTTPPPRDDVTALFPGLSAYAVTATRLHPRRGRPQRRRSHVGGPLWWPAGEPWPTCEADHVVPTQTPVPEPMRARLAAARRARNWADAAAVLAELASEIPGFAGIDHRDGIAHGRVARPEPEPTPLVAIAQLRAADVPALAPPPGTDLLQVLWCPNDHDIDGAGGDGLAPVATLRWRAEATLPARPGEPPPKPAVSEARYLPHPCVIDPEQVVEYPWWQDLPAGLGYRVHAWDGERDGRYHRQLATAPGWKVGGWPAWPTTDAVPLLCAGCGGRMTHLLQIDSGEWGDPARWRPVEERGLRPGTAAHTAATEPTGVIVGRCGMYRVFRCPACPDRARVNLQ